MVEFNPEDRCSTFLWNDGTHLPDYVSHIPHACNMNLKRTQYFIQDKYMTVEILQDFIL
jgi:hypothetical protein